MVYLQKEENVTQEQVITSRQTIHQSDAEFRIHSTSLHLLIPARIQSANRVAALVVGVVEVQPQSPVLH